MCLISGLQLKKRRWMLHHWLVAVNGVCPESRHRTQPLCHRNICAPKLILQKVEHILIYQREGCRDCWPSWCRLPVSALVLVVICFQQATELTSVSSFCFLDLASLISKSLFLHHSSSCFNMFNYSTLNSFALNVTRFFTFFWYY